MHKGWLDDYWIVELIGIRLEVPKEMWIEGNSQLQGSKKL